MLLQSGPAAATAAGRAASSRNVVAQVPRASGAARVAAAAERASERPAFARRSARRSRAARPPAAAVVDAPPAAAAAYAEVTRDTPGAVQRDAIRNIAIIAHVDHGKTTLVDAMLKQSKVFRDNQESVVRVMDSNALERERGITILAKNTAITYKGTKINVIDTPGHADFGGEVERVLNMCDGVVLLVDAVEGPMPQTRFVTKKAFELGKTVLVVVNKVDRPAARPDWVVDATYELFMDLGASDEQIDFPVVFASGAQGVAGTTADSLAEDLSPLFDAIVRQVPPPTVLPDAPLQLLAANIDYDEHKGRIAIGRVTAGTITKGQQVQICTSLEPGKCRTGKISELFVYNDFLRVPVDEVAAGDICALTGIADISIGETVCAKEFPAVPLPTIKVEEPTVSMTFRVNTSPFAGKEGKFVTSRNLRERLDRELERNLAMRVEQGETADAFVVSGRGTLHLGILIENMRREGYEFEIGSPRVITRVCEETGVTMEPFEEASVEVPEQYVGAVVEMFAGRKAEMVDMQPSLEGTTKVTFKIATRGLLGLKNQLLSATRGMGLVNTLFDSYRRLAGDITMRENGSLVAFETGSVTAYSVESAQERGTLFVRPGTAVYEGQVVGVYNKPGGDLKVNLCKAKQLTNHRAAGKDNTTVLDEPRVMGLEEALEFVDVDELVEVTPLSIRIRKDPLAANKGRKSSR